MPLYNFVVLLLFTILGLAMILLFISGGIRHRKNPGAPVRVLGKPSIHPFFFYSSKIAFGLVLMLFLLKALMPGIGWVRVPYEMSWAGAFVMLAAVFFFIRAFIDLGPALLVGLPDFPTELRTHGIYALTRNPIYLAVYFFCLAACLYFPEPSTIALSIYVIYFHHRIILAEEKFLEERFGEKWLAYCKKVHRYLF
ncbi:MAG TPA: methyltransferase [Bacteroidales bacterium]|nr:methyltransferase [Bacteroidales bacterium]